MAGNSDNHITQVLFCGPNWPASQNYTRDYLRSYPYIQVDDVPLDDVPDVIDKYHICVVKNLRLDSQVIARAKQMKLIMQFGVGLEGVDVVAATQCGIKVARMPGNVTGNSASCAEMAIYLMLGLLKKQKEMEAVLKMKRLGEPVGETLLGKTVFIMGFGAIGRDLAKRLRPFGVRILATKRSWSLEQPESNQSNGSAVRSPTLSMESDGNDSLVDKKGGLENLFEFAREADIVVTCLALNPETYMWLIQLLGRHSEPEIPLFNETGFPPSKYRRGGLLDYESVKHHLESGHLGGLALDVTWTEPFDPEDPILKFPNVLVTPHVAGATEFSCRKMAKVVGDCALQLHAGDPLTGIEFVN